MDFSNVKTPQEAIDLIIEGLKKDPKKASGINLRSMMEISGDNGGDWYIVLEDGKYDIGKGAIDDPELTLIINDSDFIKLIKGELNPPIAIFSGRMKVKGSMGSVGKLNKILN